MSRRLDLGGLYAEQLAGNAGVPVHERTVGVIFPRPNMQCVEWLQSEAIGALEIMKELSVQLWRPGFM